MIDVYLGLGSNVGKRKKYLLQAMSEIEKNVEIVKTSSIYQTEPWGKKNQRSFLF